METPTAIIQEQTKVLIIDDDHKITKLVSELLHKHHFDVLTRAHGGEVLDLLKQVPIQCIILDVMLPGEDGLAICKKIRTVSIVPIIMLTALNEESDRMIGLEVGADDYLPKPFHPRELLARIKALLRRVAFYSNNGKGGISHPANKYTFAGWEVNPQSRTILSPDKVEIHVTSAEYQILLALLNSAQQVLTREFLLDTLYNGNPGPFDRSVDIHISRLRQKLEDDPKMPKIIKTIRNGGYIMAATVERC